jgi:hypothetical protein
MTPLDIPLTDTGQLIAEELSAAMTRRDIPHVTCHLLPCGHVGIVFESTLHAEALLALAVPPQGPGSLYDRACCGAVTLAELHELGVSLKSDQALAAMDAGWAWACYPEQTPTGVQWHVNVDLTVDDAAAMAVNLNAGAR